MSAPILFSLLLLLPMIGTSHGILPAAGVRNPPETSTPVDLTWRGLEYRATKFFFSATVRITVTRLQAGEALEEMVSLGGDLEGLLPTGEAVDRIHTAATMTTGKYEVVDTWIDAATGAVLQTVKEVRGRGNYWKLRRFFPDGYHQIREAPMDRRERKLARDRWTKHVETMVRWNALPPEGSVVTSSYALIYLLSRKRFDWPHNPELWFVPVKRDLVELHLSGGAPRHLKVRVDERWPGGSALLAGRIDTPTVRVIPRWLEGRSGEPAANGFMGMHGPADIALLPGSGIPLRIDGTVRGAGHVASRLVRIHWK